MHQKSDSNHPKIGQGPLNGLKVLDIATIIAGPMAATLLSDYGADVLKVELPINGDGAREFPPIKNGKGLWWKSINRNKKFITLDLRKPEGADILKKLIAKYDVLIENFRPGTLDRWGLSSEVLWEINPHLVILRTTGFGQDGPYRNKPGFGRIFEALGGLTFITGESDGEPMHSGYPMGDAIGGLFGAIGILAALSKRMRNPDALGEEIDLSMTEGVLRILDFLPIEYDQLGTIRSRMGNSSQYSAPSAVYRTLDNHFVSLSGSTDRLFACNARAIGREDLINEPKFLNNTLRVSNSKELNKIFSNWIAKNNLSDVLESFEAAQGTISPINSIAQITLDPQMIYRKAIIDVDDADFGSVKLSGVVPRFRNDPCKVRNTAGGLGQDNCEIYKTILGLSIKEQDELRRKGVI